MFCTSKYNKTALFQPEWKHLLCARIHNFFLTLEQMHAACLWLRCHPRAPARPRPVCYLRILIQDTSAARAAPPTFLPEQKSRLCLAERKCYLAMREFGTRTSFRPRPLDINRQLPIVRDLAELDSTEGLVSREITHNHEALDKENEEVRQKCLPHDDFGYSTSPLHLCMDSWSPIYWYACNLHSRLTSRTEPCLSSQD